MLILVVSSGCALASYIVGNRERQWCKSPLSHNSCAAAASTAVLASLPFYCSTTDAFQLPKCAVWCQRGEKDPLHCKGEKLKDEKQNKCRGGPPGWWDWSTCPMRRGWRSWAGSSWRRIGFGAVSPAQCLKGETQTSCLLSPQSHSGAKHKSLHSLRHSCGRPQLLMPHSTKEMETQTCPSSGGLAGGRRWRSLLYWISCLCKVTTLWSPGHFVLPCWWALCLCNKLSPVCEFVYRISLILNAWRSIGCKRGLYFNETRPVFPKPEQTLTFINPLSQSLGCYLRVWTEKTRANKPVGLRSLLQWISKDY